MKLTAPIFRLKREAKLTARAEGIPLHKALDRIARREGFTAWSHLSALQRDNIPARAVFQQLTPGEMALIAARPGHGKTMLALGVVAEAVQAGRQAFVFSLEETETALAARYEKMGGIGPFEVDTSDGICADHIIARLSGAAAGTLAVIDYLQLLDQRRSIPPLEDQIAMLADFATRSGVIFACISQVDRRFEKSDRALPRLADLRLPNPVDLRHFAKACFLADGEVEVVAL